MNRTMCFMKFRAYLPGPAALRLSATLAWLALAFLAARAQAPAAAVAPATNVVSNTTAFDFAAPKSVFILPKSPKEGKDPFFPRSPRPYASTIVVRTNQAVETPSTVELRLQGISGPPERRLAIINNRTFGAGEDGEVPSQAGRVHIRCLEIKSDSVVVTIGSERRELRLRGAF